MGLSLSVSLGGAGTPFEDEEQSRVFEKIAHSSKHLRFPRGFDKQAKALIRGLLRPNPVLRFGMFQPLKHSSSPDAKKPRTGVPYTHAVGVAVGVARVKAMPWFPGGDWFDDLLTRDARVEPPFVPESVLKHKADVHLFGEEAVHSVARTKKEAKRNAGRRAPPQSGKNIAVSLSADMQSIFIGF